MNLRDPIRRLRLIATIEAVTLLVLVGAIIWRLTADGPDLGPVLGPIHGIAFTGYVVAALHARPVGHWSAVRTIVILVAAAIPIVGYLVVHRITESDAHTGNPAPGADSASPT